MISLVLAAATLFPSKTAYFEEARDAIVEAIGAAEGRGNVTARLPPSALSCF